MDIDLREGDSAFSALDDRASAAESNGWMHGFTVGDMVWGKVKSHPWWPGHIFNEAFASPSVLMTKSEGHVLVAFFGDSSYGWFCPADLIPFAPHFPEQSRQTTSRRFVRAVEDAVDEARRRGALSLTCRCRNPHNFRPANVAGYLTVDVVGYAHGFIYSSVQIKKAKDSFVPVELFSFLQHLAVAPCGNDGNTIEWIQSTAKLLAYRKAVFEEFDETFAEAYGVQSVRRTLRSVGVSGQPHRFATRVFVLSGPQVVPEALGERRSSANHASNKTAKNPKKNKLEPKQAQEMPPSFVLKTSGESLLPGYPEEPVTVEGKNERREPPAENSQAHIDGIAGVKQEKFEPMQPQEMPPSLVLKTSGESLLPGYPEEPVTVEGQTERREPPAENSQAHIDRIAGVKQETFEPMQPQEMPPSFVLKTSGESLLPGYPEKPVTVEGKNERRESPAENSQAHIDGIGGVKKEKFEPMQPQEMPPSFVLRTSGESLLPGYSEKPGTVEGKNERREPPAENSQALIDGMAIVKQEKVAKRMRDDLNDKAEVKKKKKKKKAKDQSTGYTVSDQSRVPAGSSIGTGVSASAQEGGINMELPPRRNSSSLKLRQLFDDLASIALDPYYAIERHAPTIVRNVFLRYRSLVYQKSLIYTVAGDPAMPAQPLSTEKTELKEIVSSKPRNPASRSEDPTKASRKRNPSKRQEELSAKKMKKMNHLKAITRKKNSEVQQQQKPPAKVLTDSALKEELPPPPRASSPTVLIMTFPPSSALPSMANLKARLARFGPLDLSATRMYWKTNSCKVVFKHKSDALSAFDFLENNDLFSQGNVHYLLRDAKPSDLNHHHSTPGSASLRRPSAIPQAPQKQKTVQPKSILKKPCGDDQSGPAESLRVKFMLNEDVDRSEPPKSVASSSNASKSIGFSPPPPQHPPPAALHRTWRPPPAPLQRPGVDFNGSRELPPLAPPSEPRDVDISGPMLSLLLKCNEIVSNALTFVSRRKGH